MVARGTRRKRFVQQELDFRVERRGGARKGAGRKARPDRAGFVPHVRRPAHDERHPVHVTVRRVVGAPSLRQERIFAIVRAFLAKASERGFRLLHFAVQRDHVHFVVEATTKVALARGVQRLLSRIALAVNAASERRGALWRDRYHRRDLTSPRQVRNAYAYVLFNTRKHEIRGNPRAYDILTETLDTFSSAVWFEGWSPQAPPPAVILARAGPPIVARAKSWLAHTGWKKRGLLRFDEVPSST